jgi:hypothetical protein
MSVDSSDDTAAMEIAADEPRERDPEY